jgi:ketosteroid isomerase-like protein
MTFVANAQKDEELIKQTVEAEAKALKAGNIERVRSLWKYDPKSKQTILIASGAKGFILYFSGEGMAVNSNYPPKTTVTFQNYDYQIKVSGNLAFARYSTIETSSDGSKLHSFRTDLLEKVEKEWKIIGVTKHEYIPK